MYVLFIVRDVTELHTHPHKRGCWGRASWDEDTNKMLCGYNQWDKGGSKDLFHCFLRMGLRLKKTGWNAFKPGKGNTRRRKIIITSYELRRTALLKGARNNICWITTGKKKKSYFTVKMTEFVYLRRDDLWFEMWQFRYLYLKSGT